MTLPVHTIAAITFTMLLTILLPLVLLFRIQKLGGKWSTFADGAVVFFLFAMVLEQLAHTVILGSPLGTVLRENLWLYALYGGLMAALFEETGRLAAFRLLLRRQTQPVTALAYGAGHGGCEAVLITGLTMLNNLILLFTLSNGGTLTPELTAAAEYLLTIPATMFLWAGLERIVVIAFHIALSVLVFASVHQPEKRWLFPVAVVLHLLMDFVVIVTNSVLSTAGTEIVAAVLTVLVAVPAGRVYKKIQAAPENT